MPFITDDHLKASATRQNISDCPARGQKGFVLRTTPNGVFTFYYQYLNKKRLHPTTGKPIREWHLIGQYPAWTIARARAEATTLAGLVASGKSITAERQQTLVLALIPISRTTLLRLERDKVFPRGEAITPHRKLWFKDEVIAWQRDLRDPESALSQAMRTRNTRASPPPQRSRACTHINAKRKSAF
ncbi:putative DNA-binding transcriptional regulator AlpA [Bradyrhizobium yuanmingense]|uniref:integrase arm-type DNA-binding domain-containing protein n=1 Tax=Bradyrhizobium yuanmingense TaxID=108015 RepID=UPI0035120E90